MMVTKIFCILLDIFQEIWGGVFLIPKMMRNIFTESAPLHWADSVIESSCRCVCGSAFRMASWSRWLNLNIASESPWTNKKSHTYSVTWKYYRLLKLKPPHINIAMSYWPEINISTVKKWTCTRGGGGAGGNWHDWKHHIWSNQMRTLLGHL